MVVPIVRDHSERHFLEVDPDMRCLEIAADIEFLKPIPNYSDIECALRVLAIVAGDQPPDKEIRRLEAFRRTVLRLVKEGLHHEPGCEASDRPYVSLTIKAGEECKKPSWEMDAFIGVNENGSCRLRFSAGKDVDRDLSFTRLEDALAEIKMLLDRETGCWAAQVAFGREPAGK